MLATSPRAARGDEPRHSPAPRDDGGPLGARLVELRAWLHATSARCAILRLWLPKTRTDVALDIAADCATAAAHNAATAHRAETHDRECARRLSTVLADGQVTPAEIPDLQAALRLALLSAEDDHTIAENNTLPTA